MKIKMLKAMINNFQNFRSEYGGTNTNPEDQLVPNVPPLFYQNEPKENKPRQKTSVAGAGTMSRGGKGVLKTGTLGKKRKRIAMPGTPMPKKPTGKVNDSPDYEFSTLPPPPDYDLNESNDIMEEMPPPPPPTPGNLFEILPGGGGGHGAKIILHYEKIFLIFNLEIFEICGFKNFKIESEVVNISVGYSVHSVALE